MGKTEKMVEFGKRTIVLGEREGWADIYRRGGPRLLVEVMFQRQRGGTLLAWCFLTKRA